MQKKNEKKFLTYDEQINLLKSKKLEIENVELAISQLKKYGYFSLVSGYKDIFKIEKNGNYKTRTTLEDIIYLYLFDDYLRNTFLQEIIRIEKHIKSLYSYSFCALYGDKQSDYLNVNNYNYGHYQKDINVFITLVNNILDNPERYKYIKHNITTYGSVPLWVLIQSLTLGNVSKMYNFSSNKLQSQIAREFKNVYGPELSSMLNILSKFRNVCAHGERLYSYATKKEIKNLPIYSRIDNYTPTARNNLFAVYICIKYLSTDDDFNLFSSHLKNVFNILHNSIKQELASLVMQSMGFPKNWMDITDLEK